MRLGIGWSGELRAWSFPMTDAAGTVLGIRLRGQDGSKFAVRGGKEGLFLPAGLPPEGGRRLVCEGPTDAAALVDMGFHSVVGRPSCIGGIKLVTELVRRRKTEEVVIVADGDVPGRRGADSLASVLLVFVTVVRVIQPPDGIKDARDWLRAGGNRLVVEAVIRAAPVRRLSVSSREVCRGG
jgi:hypothetical protein